MDLAERVEGALHFQDTALGRVLEVATLQLTNQKWAGRMFATATRLVAKPNIALNRGIIVIVVIMIIMGSGSNLLLWTRLHMCLRVLRQLCRQRRASRCPSRRPSQPRLHRVANAVRVVLPSSE